MGCRAALRRETLRCAGAGGDSCLTDAQVRPSQTLHSPYRFDFELANGVREYPGRGLSGENLAAYGPTGGWSAWWLGTAPPSLPPPPNNGIAWFYGGGAIQYFYARNPRCDVSSYKPADHAARVQRSRR